MAPFDRSLSADPKEVQRALRMIVHTLKQHPKFPVKIKKLYQMALQREIREEALVDAMWLLTSQGLIEFTPIWQVRLKQGESPHVAKP